VIFYSLGHIDPFLHPVFLRSRQRVDEEYAKEPSIDTDMTGAHCTDSEGVYVGCAGGAEDSGDFDAAGGRGFEFGNVGGICQ